VQCILYGLFLCLFAASSTIIIQRSRKGGSKRVLIISIVMFILGTIHVGVDLRRLLNGFIGNPNPDQYLSAVNTIGYEVKSTAYCMQTLVGDGFILYRLHLVWNGDKRIVLPIAICFVASIGVGIGALQGFARTSPAEPVFISELHDWIVSFFSLTLFTNFSSTSLIAGRIWWIHRKVLGNVIKGGSLMPAVIVVIESGAIYSACLVILLSLYLSGSYAQYIALDAVTQVIGIVFSLIIIRVALGVSSTATTTAVSISILDTENGGPAATNKGSRTAPRVQPMSINIARTIDRDYELTSIGYSKEDESHAV